MAAVAWVSLCVWIEVELCISVECGSSVRARVCPGNAFSSPVARDFVSPDVDISVPPKLLTWALAGVTAREPLAVAVVVFSESAVVPIVFEVLFPALFVPTEEVPDLSDAGAFQPVRFLMESLANSVEPPVGEDCCAPVALAGEIAFTATGTLAATEAMIVAVVSDDTTCLESLLEFAWRALVLLSVLLTVFPLPADSTGLVPLGIIASSPLALV
ncbi:MAG: hypothetical protein P4K94_09635 [Terracidiphilus sp.]|nr:hypothetical protein [Terracidiphilus sp.]